MCVDVCKCDLYIHIYVYMTFVYVRVPPMQGSKRAVAAPLLPQPVMRHIDIYKCTCSYILKINIYMYICIYAYESTAMSMTSGDPKAQARIDWFLIDFSLESKQK